MAFTLFGKKQKKEKQPAKPAVSERPERIEEKGEKTVASVPVVAPNVLKHLHVSEKSAQGERMNQYTFIVAPRASKPEIAKEVASRYGVDVVSVNVTRLPAKQRRLGRYVGTTNSRKKATVTIREGQRITAA